MTQTEKKNSIGLLSLTDEEPFKLVNPNGKASIVLTCEHAGRAIPTSLGDLGLSKEIMERHIAYDIGVENVACQLSTLLDATLILQPYSRLVVDCNRPLNASDCVPGSSDGIDIPGNFALDDIARQQRYDEISKPFHKEVSHQIDVKQQTGKIPVLISVHSFTPKLRVNGRLRPWHLGLLYNRDDKLATGLLEILNNRYPQFNVALNEPYNVTDTEDFTIPVHGEQRGIPHVMLEINNNEIGDLIGQAHWASILAECITEWIT